MRFIPFLFLAGFMGEIASIIIAGHWFGVVPVLGLLVVSGLVGAKLIKSAGMGMAEAIRQAPGIRETATSEAIAKLLQVVAGLLLILPGFLSDAAAVLLLIPMVRRLLVPWIADGISVTPRRPRQNYADGPIIEGNAVEIQAPLEGKHEPSRPATRT